MRLHVVGSLFANETGDLRCVFVRHLREDGDDLVKQVGLTSPGIHRHAKRGSAPRLPAKSEQFRREQGEWDCVEGASFGRDLDCAVA